MKSNSTPVWKNEWIHITLMANEWNIETTKRCLTAIKWHICNLIRFGDCILVSTLCFAMQEEVNYVQFVTVQCSPLVVYVLCVCKDCNMRSYVNNSEHGWMLCSIIRNVRVVHALHCFISNIEQLRCDAALLHTHTLSHFHSKPTIV